MLALSTFATARRVTSVSGNTVFSSADKKLVVAFSVGKSAGELENCLSLIQRGKVKTAEDFYQLLLELSQQLQSTAGEMAGIWLDQETADVYVAAQQGAVWLRRGEKQGQLLEADAQLKMIQGKAQEGDWYFCATKSANLLFEESYAGLFSERGLDKDQFHDLEQKTAQSSLRDKSAIAFTQLVERPQPFYQQLFHKNAKNLHHSLRNLRRDQQIKQKMVKKILPFFAVVLLIVVSVIGNVLWKETQKIQAAALLKPYQETFLQIRQEPDHLQSKRRLVELQGELESLQQYQQSNFTGQQVRAFYDQVALYSHQISGQVSLAELPPFFDFRLVKANFIASAADVENNTAVFLDRQEKVVILLNLDTKEQTLLPLSDYDNLQDIVVVGEQVYLLGNGIYRVTVGGRVEAEELVSPSAELEGSTFLGAFDNFLYAFNAGERNIYRFLLDAVDTAKPIGWIQDKKDIDFAQINAMSIDGSVWLGTANGQIIKFERGQQVSFVVEGVDDPFNSPLKLFSTSEGNHLFVLESAKKRVVILEKSGRFVKEIRHESIGAATNLFARESDQRVYIVAGSTLYSTTY